MINIKVVPLTLNEETLRDEAERAERNRLLWEASEAPSCLADVAVGDLVVPQGEQWQRGPGRVDEVDEHGNVWVVYGQRERPHESDSKTIRCFSYWREIRIVERIKRAR